MTTLLLPPTLERYVVGQDVVDATVTFLRARGVLGVEGTILWLGDVESAWTARVTTAYVPQQVAYRIDGALAVEVTQPGLSALILSLPAGVFVLARVHSHAGRAFHSATDDRNLIVSHERAVSIVVPDFARGNFDLRRCSVNELRHGTGWSEMDHDEIERRFVIR